MNLTTVRRLITWFLCTVLGVGCLVAGADGAAHAYIAASLVILAIGSEAP